MKGTIVVSGSIAQKPWHGGHTWVFLNYLLGFKKLGWDVLFIDQLDPALCVDRVGRPSDIVSSVNCEFFSRMMRDFNLDGSYALLCGGTQSIGLSRKEIAERISASALLLNVMGFLRDPELLERSPNRVFLDIDPGFGQMWQDLGLQQVFSDYHHHVSIGENLGRPGCAIPTCGLQWITTPQPIVLDFWHRQPECPDGAVTSIASWRGAYGPVPFQGKTYGLRVHEFRKFAALPALTSARFELALDIHPADFKDKGLLEENGWALVDPRRVAGDPWRYQKYLWESSAEFMVAKNMYVETRSGWFSDRSICYLASGRPVIAQDTGISALYPTGRGLLIFRSLEEAVSRVEELTRDYAAHAAAAYSLAQEYFDSNKVLCRLLQKLNVN